MLSASGASGTFAHMKAPTPLECGPTILDVFSMHRPFFTSVTLTIKYVVRSSLAATIGILCNRGCPTFGQGSQTYRCWNGQIDAWESWNIIGVLFLLAFSFPSFPFCFGLLIGSLVLKGFVLSPRLT
jgi:hypothetical protein